MLATIDPGRAPLAVAFGGPGIDAAAPALTTPALAVLNCLAHGVVLVDHLGRICWRNAAAAAIIGRRDGLVARGNTLYAADATAECARLSRLIRDAGEGRSRGAGVVAVPRATRRPLHLLVMPLPEATADVPSAYGPVPAAAVFITDPDGRNAAPAEALVLKVDTVTTEQQPVA